MELVPPWPEKIQCKAPPAKYERRDAIANLSELGNRSWLKLAGWSCRQQQAVREDAHKVLAVELYIVEPRRAQVYRDHCAHLISRNLIEWFGNTYAIPDDESPLHITPPQESVH
jgi:hypothetical protein